MNLKEVFGDIDIYLFDQLLRGRLVPGMRILDAGCGGGRNVVYLLRAGFEVYASDADPEAVQQVRRLVGSLAPHLPATNVHHEQIEQSSFDDRKFDAVISNAVLHFAQNEEHFGVMLHEMWRLLRPGGLFFCRLASTVTLTHRRVSGRRFVSPDGTERFLVDEPFLLAQTESLGAELIDPLKTTVIQDARCMTTWVLRKTP